MNWDLIIKAIALIGPSFVGYSAFKKYTYEKNREIYIRRLNEVYAPLYGHLVKQETIRSLFLTDRCLEDYPVLELTSKTVNTKTDLATGKVVEESVSNKKILDRENFLKILNDTNKGLARPELLKLLNTYEILIHLENSLRQNSEEWKKATNKKVDIELKLFREICKGYEDTIIKLELDDKSQISDLERFKL